MPRSSFWTDIGDTARQSLIKRGRRVAYKDREIIFEQGLTGVEMLVVETGNVVVFTTSDTGTAMMLQHLGPGQVVGEIALLDRNPRSASVAASGPVTGVLLHFDAVRTYFLEAPEVMFALVADLTKKLRAANALMEMRSIENASVRLASCLLQLAEDWGTTDANGARRMTKAFSQRELGDVAGLTRETVNRKLRAWASKGWLSQDDGVVTLTDVEALRLLASDAGP